MEDLVAILRRFSNEAKSRGFGRAEFSDVCLITQKALDDILKAHPGSGQDDKQEHKEGWQSHETLKIEQVIAERLWQKPLRKIFLHYDVLNTGTLCPAEFRMIIERELHIKLSEDDLKHLIQKYDLDGNGYISYGEFAKQVGDRQNLTATTSSLAYAKALQNRTPTTSMRTMMEEVPIPPELKLQQHLAQIRNKMKARMHKTNGLFLEMDRNRSGLLSVSELHRGLKHYGVDIPVNDLKDLMREFGKQRPGFLTYEEFTAFVRDISAETPLMSAQQHRAMNTPRTNRRKAFGKPSTVRVPPTSRSIPQIVKEIATRLQSKGQKMRTLFSFLDADCDGCLAADELCSGVLRHAHMRVSNEAARDIIATFDKNRDGKMQYSEFVNMLQSALRR